MDLTPGPFKFIPTPGLLMMLYEGDTNFFRQIYTDGRKLPADPQPSWLGYSVGKWSGDWFVIDTIGFNDKGVMDAMGHPHSAGMRLTERFHRRDFGHMDLEITVDDQKTYAHAGHRQGQPAPDVPTAMSSNPSAQKAKAISPTCAASRRQRFAFTSGRASGTNPSRFGILTLGSVVAFISSFSPTIPFAFSTNPTTE